MTGAQEVLLFVARKSSHYIMESRAVDIIIRSRQKSSFVVTQIFTHSQRSSDNKTEAIWQVVHSYICSRTACCKLLEKRLPPQIGLYSNSYEILHL